MKANDRKDHISKGSNLSILNEINGGATFVSSSTLSVTSLAFVVK
jgi:hypothetical protein